MNMNVRRPEGVEVRASEGLEPRPTLGDFVEPDTLSWRRCLGYLAVGGAAVYFVATANVTTLLITGGIVVGLFGLLFAGAMYMQNSVDWRS